MIFEVIQEIIQPWLESNVRTLIVLGIALAFYALIQRYNRPPSTLAHLPYVSFFSFLKYGFKDELYDTYAKEKLLPLLKANGGFFTVSDKNENEKKMGNECVTSHLPFKVGLYDLLILWPSNSLR